MFAALELGEGSLCCDLRVLESLRVAMVDWLLVARRTEQLPANNGGAGAIGRQVEHHQLVITNERVCL